MVLVTHYAWRDRKTNEVKSFKYNRKEGCAEALRLARNYVSQKITSAQLKTSFAQAIGFKFGPFPLEKQRAYYFTIAKYYPYETGYTDYLYPPGYAKYVVYISKNSLVTPKYYDEAIECRTFRTDKLEDARVICDLAKDDLGIIELRTNPANSSELVMVYRKGQFRRFYYDDLARKGVDPQKIAAEKAVAKLMPYPTTLIYGNKGCFFQGVVDQAVDNLDVKRYQYTQPYRIPGCANEKRDFVDGNPVYWPRTRLDKYETMFGRERVNRGGVLNATKSSATKIERRLGEERYERICSSLLNDRSSPLRLLKRRGLYYNEDFWNLRCDLGVLGAVYAGENGNVLQMASSIRNRSILFTSSRLLGAADKFDELNFIFDEQSHLDWYKINALEQFTRQPRTGLRKQRDWIKELTSEGAKYCDQLSHCPHRSPSPLGMRAAKVFDARHVPLADAVAAGRTDQIDALLRRGLKIDALGSISSTTGSFRTKKISLLHWAVLAGKLNSYEHLLRLGARMDFGTGAHIKRLGQPPHLGAPEAWRWALMDGDKRWTQTSSKYLPNQDHNEMAVNCTLAANFECLQHLVGQKRVSPNLRFPGPWFNGENASTLLDYAQSKNIAGKKRLQQLKCMIIRWDGRLSENYVKYLYKQFQRPGFPRTEEDIWMKKNNVRSLPKAKLLMHMEEQLKFCGAPEYEGRMPWT